MYGSTENDIDLGDGGYGVKSYVDQNESADHLAFSNANQWFTPDYVYSFKNREELISSAVFQECLSKALAFKDKLISELQNELLNRNA